MTMSLSGKYGCTYWPEEIMSNTDVSQGQIAEFCKRWRVVRLSVSGSVMRDDFYSNSDIDHRFLVEQNKFCKFQDILRMEQELKVMFGRKVDIVDQRTIENGRNYLRRKLIYETMEVIYDSG